MSEVACPGGPDPDNINNPTIEFFEPSVLLREDSKIGLQ